MIGAATARLLLKCSLAMGSCILLLAAVCAVFPCEWYMFIHRLLGLGEFPDQPVAWYLARSASALYAFHGVLVGAIAWRPERAPWLVVALGLGNIVFGLSMIAIDISAGMPWWWTLGEGPGIAGFGFVLLVLEYLTRQGESPS